MAGDSLTMTSPDPAALFPAIAQGDETALAGLYQQLGARLYGVALRLSRRHDLAASVLEDLFVQLPRILSEQLALPTIADAWLVELVRTRALDQRRKADLTPAAEDAAALSDIAAASTAEAPVLSTEIRALLGRLGQLEAQKRRLLLLAYYDGYSLDELAARQGIPVANVRDWLGQCMRAIAETTVP